METKPADEIYCSVNKEKIKTIKPILDKENLKYFYNWITQRYEIHIKKDVLKEKVPWTKDPVLLKYRFTNVRREQDRESIWLIKNVSLNKKVKYENKILNSILFRLINKSQTLEIIGDLDFDKIDFKELNEKIEEYGSKNRDYCYFSNAFYTSGPKTAGNSIFGKGNNVINMIKLVSLYKNEDIVKRIAASKNQKEVYDNLKSCKGIGQFLAYQIFVDLTYIKEFPFSENEFVVAGPGCKKGLDMLFKDFKGLTYEEAVFWIRDNQYEIFKEFGYSPDKLFSDLVKEERHLNLMSIQNCFCELSKYIRAIKGEGRPRILYKST